MERITKTSPADLRVYYETKMKQTRNPDDYVSDPENPDISIDFEVDCSDFSCKAQQYELIQYAIRSRHIKCLVCSLRNPHKEIVGFKAIGYAVINGQGNDDVRLLRFYRSNGEPFGVFAGESSEEAKRQAAEVWRIICESVEGDYMYEPEREPVDLYYKVDPAILESHAAAVTAYKGTDCNGQIEIPVSIDGYHVWRVARGAFYQREDFITVKIPDGVRFIDYSAFENCCHLTDVYIPASIIRIGSVAFRGCPHVKLHIAGDRAAYEKQQYYPWGVEESQIIWEAVDNS